MAWSERQRSGIGQFLETTLYETGHHASARRELFHAWQAAAAHRQRASQSGAVCDFFDRTDDIFIGVGNDGAFRKLASEIGKPELGTDPRFARNKDRIANRGSAARRTRHVFSQHDAGPLCDRLLDAGLPAGPVQSIDQALSSAHAFHRGDVIAKDSYQGVASPIRLERSKPSLRNVPPKSSEHASVVPSEFGCSGGEIDALLAKGRGLRRRAKALIWPGNRAPVSGEPQA